MGKGIKRLVLDILKPLEGVSMVELAKILGKIPGVNGVNISLREIDKQTETVKLTIVGTSLNYGKILSELDKYSAVVHSVDEVAAGTKIIEKVKTPQD